MTEEISSRRNPLLVLVRKLAAHRTARREQGLFLAEGRRLLEEALLWNAPLDVVISARGVSLPPLPDHLRHVVVPEDVLTSISPLDNPQGVLFLCRMPDLTPPASLIGNRWLILDGLQDPGNVGTIWRTSDALGADGLLLVGACADPWNPKTVRATMGACFRLPVWEVDETLLSPLLTRSGLPLYAAALRGDTADLRELDLSHCAVAIGSEGAGVSPAVLAMSRQTLKIPMRPRCESLNAAVAAAIILWEMAR